MIQIACVAGNASWRQSEVAFRSEAVNKSTFAEIGKQERFFRA
jgi:hypothetical protein